MSTKPRGWGKALCLTFVAVVITTALAVAPARAAAVDPGDLDTSFGIGGTIQTSFTRNNAAVGAWIEDTAVQSDGRIVAVGTSMDIEAPAPRFSTFAIARYLSDGRLDPSFSGDGMVQIGFGDVSAGAHSVAVAPNGKIVVAGQTGDADTNGEAFAVARLEADGDLDPTFSGDGKVVTDLGAFNNFARGVEVQSDGKVVVVGTNLTDDVHPEMTLLRYTSTGILDATFAGDGRQTVAVADRSYGQGLALAANGSIIAVGMDLANVPSEFLVARVTSAGNLDPTFSADGLTTVGFGGLGNHAVQVALPGDGSIIVLGEMLAAQENYFALARLSTAGTLDATFSGDGKLTTQFGGLSSSPHGVAIEEDGKILAAGTAGTGFAQTVAVARYASNGTPDITFGTLGQRTVQIDGLPSSGISLSLTANSKFVVGGYVVRNGVTAFSITSLNGGPGILVAVPPPVPPPAGGGGAADPGAGQGAGADGAGAVDPGEAVPGPPTITNASERAGKLVIDWQPGPGGAPTTYTYRSQRLRNHRPVRRAWSSWTSVNSNTTSVTLPLRRRIAGYRFEITATNAAGVSASVLKRWRRQ